MGSFGSPFVYLIKTTEFDPHRFNLILIQMVLNQLTSFTKSLMWTIQVIVTTPTHWVKIQICHLC